MNNLYVHAENKLLVSEKLKFKKCNVWRKDNVPDEAGIYAIFDNHTTFIYIGEGGMLKKKITELEQK